MLEIRPHNLIIQKLSEMQFTSSQSEEEASIYTPSQKNSFSSEAPEISLINLETFTEKI